MVNNITYIKIPLTHIKFVYYNRAKGKTMRIPRNKIKLAAGLILISLVFLYLRLKTLNHLLMWDEARNIISLRAFLSNNWKDPFYWNYFFHPPLYMVFASLLAPFKAGLDIRLELLSLFFSYLTLLFMYMISVKMGGWKYAFFNGLLLSLMPASIAYDTWTKRDCLACALGYLAILLLLRKKFFWCAVALSFSLLAKENALFFILAVTCILLISKERGIFKKIATIYGVIFALSWWWYIYFSSMPGLISDIYLSAERNLSSWINSPFYYLKKMLPDAGLPILVFFIIGTVHLLYLIFMKKQRKWSLPLIIFLSVYIPGSFFIACKTPWLCLSAVPAIGMIAGNGALFLLKNLKRSRVLLVLFTVLFIFSIFGGVSFSYEKYHIKTYQNGWMGANYSRELALYLNKHMRPGERLMLTQFSYWGRPLCIMCPIFLYYFDGKPVYVIDGNDSAEEVIKEIANKKISWLAVSDSYDERFNFHKLVKDAVNSILGKPAIAGSSYIWKTDSLWYNK